MATGSLLVKMIIFYFCINAVLYAGGAFDNGGALSNSPGLLTTMLNIDTTNSSSLYDGSATVGVSSSLQGNFTANVDEQAASGVLTGFIDVLKMARNFIKFCTAMLGGLPILLTQSTIFPPLMRLFFGTIMVILGFVAIIYFARSGQ